MPLTSASVSNSGVYLSRYLDENGDGSGNNNAIGNYAAAATDFFIQPGEGERFDIARLIPSISDSAAFSGTSYGGIGALTNGVRLLKLDSGGNILFDYTAGDTVKSNAGWSAYCYDVTISNFGPGLNYLAARWTFTKGGAPITLRDQQQLVIRLNDDLSGLDSHRFLVQGVTL